MHVSLQWMLLFRRRISRCTVKPLVAPVSLAQPVGGDPHATCAAAWLQGCGYMVHCTLDDISML
jgi:hypothetical protein